MIFVLNQTPFVYAAVLADEHVLSQYRLCSFVLSQALRAMGHKELVFYRPKRPLLKKYLDLTKWIDWCLSNWNNFEWMNRMVFALQQEHIHRFKFRHKAGRNYNFLAVLATIPKAGITGSPEGLPDLVHQRKLYKRKLTTGAHWTGRPKPLLYRNVEVQHELDSGGPDCP